MPSKDTEDFQARHDLMCKCGEPYDSTLGEKTEATFEPVEVRLARQCGIGGHLVEKPGGACIRCEAVSEIERLREIEKRAKQVVYGLHGWSAEEAAAYIVTGVVQ